VLTFIFGQISGEVEGQELYRERDEDTYEVAGDMKLTDFNNLTNFGIEDPRMTTIGGVAFRLLDAMPKVGERVTVDDMVIVVQEMDGHRIARVRVGKAAALEDYEEREQGETGEPQAEAAAVLEEQPLGAGAGEAEAQQAEAIAEEPGALDEEPARRAEGM
jgi:putative hemolysin